MVFFNFSNDDEHIELWTWKRSTEYRILVVNRRSNTSNIKVEMGTDNDYGTYSGILTNYGVIGFWIDVKYSNGKIWVFKDDELIIYLTHVNWYADDS